MPIQFSHTESSSPIPEIRESLIFGFGYDSINDDYKVTKLREVTYTYCFYFNDALITYCLPLLLLQVNNILFLRTRKANGNES